VIEQVLKWWPITASVADCSAIEGALDLARSGSLASS
jgi:hypothetical protein